jgi:glutamine amidotransferase
VIVIIDYGAGNLRSVLNALDRLGYQAKITSTASEFASAQAVVLPGVGAAADSMGNLKKLGLVEPIRHFIAEGRPFLGVCIGLQLLLTGTEEGGWHECLDVIPGAVRRLPSGLKIPHMGWNQLEQRTSHPIFKGIPDETDFYFTHSFYAEPEDESIVAGTTSYGVSMCSMIIKDSLIATQFHPEKSGEYGLRMYANFLKMVSSTS